MVSDAGDDVGAGSEVTEWLQDANVACISQSRPESGLGARVAVLTTFESVPSSFANGASVGERAGFV